SDVGAPRHRGGEVYQGLAGEPLPPATAAASKTPADIWPPLRSAGTLTLRSTSHPRRVCRRTGRRSGEVRRSGVEREWKRSRPLSRVPSPGSANLLSWRQADRRTAAGERDRLGRRAARALQDRPEPAKREESSVHRPDAVEVVDRSGVREAPGDSIRALG